MYVTNSNSTLLEGSRVYLSGPMDFVGSRIIEKYMGWRSILTPIMHALRVAVLDPWNKPEIRGLDPNNEYGREGIIHSKEEYAEDFYTNPETRAKYEKDFWEIVHIDLRMTDISDFMIAFTPTNTYSVGTVHEIIIARQQKKPTLLVTPPTDYSLFPVLDKLTEDEKSELKNYGMKENPHALPSQWYGYIVSGHNLFDGFGWEGLSLRSDTFYEELIEEVLNQAEKNPENNHVDKVREWVNSYEPLKNLRGSVLDNIEFDNDEHEEMFLREYNSDTEKKHKYFWYNQPYKPRRPLLFHILSIASGYIPPKIQLNSSLNDKGEYEYESVKVKDESWLLASIAEKYDLKRDEKKE